MYLTYVGKEYTRYYNYKIDKYVTLANKSTF